MLYSKTSNGHCEIYLENDNTAKLCRILIGNTEFRGKGIGQNIIKELLRKIFLDLKIANAYLNVILEQ